jgi:hypothetical protein
MKKAIFTLDINYPKEITNITFPFLKRYANKIDADFCVINTRKYSKDYPFGYEKFQLKNLIREYNLDWAIFFDPDMLVHPDFVDITSMVNKDTIISHVHFFASLRYKYDNDFLRDGRHIGIPSYFFACSDWCSDCLFDHDFKSDLKMAIEKIVPTVHDTKTTRGDYKKGLWIDDYLLSKNIAKYGLKISTVKKMFEDSMNEKHVRISPVDKFLYHPYNLNYENKAKNLTEKLTEWELL